MRPARVLGGFFLRFIVVFVLLMAPWPGVSEAYAAFFRAGGNFLFSTFGPEGRVRFLPYADADAGQDTEVVLINRRTGAQVSIAGGSRLQGFNPTAFVLALILATPIPWSRRWQAAVFGLILINAYVALRVMLFLIAMFSSDSALALFSPGPIFRPILDFLYWVCVTSFAGWLIIPLPIWALVSFRRSDWPTILQRPTPRPRRSAE